MNKAIRKIVKQITAWSFSRLEKMRQCPHLLYRVTVDRIPQPTNAAMTRGLGVHKEAERYVLRDLPASPLPDSLKLFAKQFAQLRKEKMVQVELQLAFLRDWTQAEWFAKDAGLGRVVLDALVFNTLKGKKGRRSARCIDYKTGKFREESLEQLGLYALVIMLFYPEVDAVDTELWYLDSGETKIEMYNRDDIPRLKAYWEKESSLVLDAKAFPKKPGRKCGYCPDSKKNGGACEY